MGKYREMPAISKLVITLDRVYVTDSDMKAESAQKCSKLVRQKLLEPLQYLK